MERELTVLASGLSFLEGPRWRGDRLYVSDFFTHRVLAIDPDGALETVCEVPGQPSGLGFAPDGSLLVASMLDRRVLRLSAGRLTEHADLSRLAPFHLNDMLVDGSGGAWVGNFGSDPEADPSIRSTVLLRVDPDGGARVAADGLVFPNGMVLSGDGGTLLVAETFASRITAFDAAADGSLSNRRLWAALADRPPGATMDEAFRSGLTLPDGLALDAEGAVWLGDAGGRAALRVAEGGEILDRVPTGDLVVYAVALGGADGCTLALCTGPPFIETDHTVERRAQLLSCRVEVPRAGLP